MCSQPRKGVIQDYYSKCIKGTYFEQRIKRREFFIDRVELYSKNRKIFISSWSIKHIYDKKKAFCSFFIKHIYGIINYPDCIYFNKSKKKGNILFVKSVSEYLLCIVLEESDKGLYVLTGFRIDESYLKNIERVK